MIMYIHTKREIKYSRKGVLVHGALADVERGGGGVHMFAALSPCAESSFRCFESLILRSQ